MNRIGKISATTALAATICALAPASAHDAPFHSGLSSIEALCRDLSAAAAWAEDWRCTNAAIFDNGTERQNIHDLRRQDFDSLTGEEQAILRAADKVGAIGFCNGYGGNAFRIDYDGRPVVITSAHMLIEDNGELKCSSSQLRANAIYMPNTSYYDPDDTQANEDFYMREVGLVVPPVNVEEARESFRQGSDEYNALDYVVVFLAEDVRSDVMPNGHERGTLAYAGLKSVGDASSGSSLPSAENYLSGLYLLGVAPDRHRGLTMNYQTSCNYYRDQNDAGALWHDCATVNGSSGSLLALMGEEDLEFAGSHRFAFLGDTVMDNSPSIDFLRLWNTGIAASVIEAAQTDPRPDLLAFDIQFELKQAGCYSGALDNLWGPGSRDALSRYAQTSGLALDGFEPTQETFDLLRDRRPQEQICSG